MRKTATSVLVCAAASVLAVSACSDASRPLAPSTQGVQGGAQAELLGTVLGTANGITSLLMPPVTRTTPLTSDVSWTFTAGPTGAVSSNSAVGLTIKIPAGALSSTQTITVTALAGAPVAYSFAPHQEFNRKVVLTQNLRGTSAGSLLSLPLLSGAHFSTDQLQLTSSGLALVDELVAALANPLTRTVSFGVGHFSGWIVVSGRSEEESDGQ